jgi:hypothetical protein
MSKPPNKGGMERSSTLASRPPGANPYKTRATMQAASITKAASQQNNTGSNIGNKVSEGGKANSNEAVIEPTTTSQASTQPPPESVLQRIAGTLVTILEKDKLEKNTRFKLRDVVRFIGEEEEKARTKVNSTAVHPDRNALHRLIKRDLSSMYQALERSLCGILDTTSVTLETTAKALKTTEEVKEATNEIANKIGKVTDITDKIASTTQSYCDILAQNPAPINKPSLDPKILSDMERKARQILVEIFDEEGNNTLEKSLTELLSKANDALGKIEDADKLGKVVAETALKTQRSGIVFTLNSKEAANWLRQPENEIAFTDAFSKGSHIRERLYNLIAPRVPITFKPENSDHLRELEEVSGLRAHSVHKAKWIKPITRRRPGQSHAFAVLVIAAADTANLIIRDGLNIHGAKVRPTKQKHEPVQCMKCRRWGHFASDCLASMDTCGTCGEKHRTNACPNGGKLWCVTCESTYHASWDRNCPEFKKKCMLMDEKSPENGMPFFPTDQDWTQSGRPDRVPMDERFPARFSVNSLPINSARHAEAGPRAPPEKDNAVPPRISQKDKEHPVDRTDEVAIEQPEQAIEANNHIAIQDNSEGNNAPEAASWE